MNPLPSPSRNVRAGGPPIDVTATRLAAWSGVHDLPVLVDPLDTLIGTILSQNTSDLNSGRAFDALRARVPNWSGLLTLDEPGLANVIRSGGLANLKAKRILDTVHAIVDRRGSLDLSFLAALSTEEARGWLVSLPGVGLKTANCVLLFALNRPAMPVDTHVGRVARRLGWGAPTASADSIGPIIEAGAPPRTMLGLHLNLIRLGRLVCKAGRPLCDVCPLADGCDYRRGTA